ncbi:zinc finger protein 883-like [Maniola jurtina]|uniref:zinc finger protein 883-like n=1 Tax=Maniola jurtina TaxID=191418 RepID=UPI001E685DC8|nr:zinc finger protein 883-like [Maniola jurtina]XP_045773487.1 zinc finger protein 883-like [Maniola jurtina]
MIDFERTCRTCMKTKSEAALTNLFGPVKIERNWSLKLADLVKETITLQITEGDGLPQNLCDECVTNLQNMYTFRSQALNSENALRKLVSQSASIKNETDYSLKHENEFEYLEHAYDDFIFDNQPPKEEANNDVSMFICNICNKKFTKRKKFLKHLSNHEDPQITCPICDKQFHRQSTLKRHLNKHCETNSTSNLNNSLLENTVTDLGVKVKVENISDQYKCSECNLMLENQKSLLLHSKEHHNIDLDLEEQVYRCVECSKSYTTEQRLMKHMATHYGNGKSKLDSEMLEIKIEGEHYECPECHVVFEKHRSLASHLKKHKIKVGLKSQGTYYCGYCDKRFALKTLLRRHMKLHTEDRPFKCTQCSQCYTRQDQLVMHMSKHDGKKRYVCNLCNKAFTQLCSLKDHKRTHTGETPFLCSQCGKGFSNNSNLRQHLKRHTGLKPFSCNLCPKSFCTKGQMKSHMDTHTGVHPYKCHQCGAAFTKTNSLKKHAMIHLGVKPFACDNCSMRFSSKDHLKRHQRTHTGEKPYRCPHCSRAFTQSNDLVKHVRTHLGQNIYQCTVCQMKFRLMRELKRHYPIHYINGADPTPAQEIESPLVILKGCSDQDNIEANNIPSDRQITITFNSNVLDKNSIGDITINIEPGKITN